VACAGLRASAGRVTYIAVAPPPKGPAARYGGRMFDLDQQSISFAREQGRYGTPVACFRLA